MDVPYLKHMVSSYHDWISECKSYSLRILHGISKFDTTKTFAMRNRKVKSLYVNLVGYMTMLKSLNCITLQSCFQQAFNMFRGGLLDFIKILLLDPLILRISGNYSKRTTAVSMTHTPPTLNVTMTYQSAFSSISLITSSPLHQHCCSLFLFSFLPLLSSSEQELIPWLFLHLLLPCFQQGIPQLLAICHDSGGHWFPA
jgi:hypothetical protein